LFTKVAKGLRELETVGVLDDGATRMFGAQAAGCAPVADAFTAGVDDPTPVRPATVAKSLAIGNPGDGYYALKEARSSGGGIVSVPEETVVAGIRLLARTEGIFTEPAGGVTVSALADLAAKGTLGRGDEVVALITGSGLKTLEVLGDDGPTAIIDPQLDDLDAALEGAWS
jgi:threonine synthase